MLRPRNSRTMRWTSASSWVPSTWVCEARICSTSVEPERGRPRMKNGIAIRHAPPLPCCEEFLRAHLLRQPGVGLGELGQVPDFGVLEGIADARRSPGFSWRRPWSSSALPSAKHRWYRAIREVAGAASTVRMRATIVRKAIGLEGRQAPPGLARVRRGGDGCVILLKGVRLPTDGFQQSPPATGASPRSRFRLKRLPPASGGRGE